MQTLKQCQAPGVDVIFSVAGEKFHAHKLGLLVDLPFLDLIFFNLELGEQNETDPDPIPC
jgi:speckle-type POZ protein